MTTEGKGGVLLNGLMRVGAAAALTSLVLEFGFPLSPGTQRVLHAIELAVVAVFVAEVAIGFVRARDRRGYLRGHLLEVSLIAILAVETLTVWALFRGGTVTRLYIVGAQIYLLLGLALAALRAQERLMARRVRPAVILMGSFLLLIGVGTGLLLLPNCHAPGSRPWSFVDALFTATSAACVTGLSVRDVGTELSFRGQLVLLGIIQVGGLGLVTLAVLGLFLQQRALRLRQVMLLRDALSIETLGNLSRFLVSVMAMTLFVELVGAVALYHLRPQGDFFERAWWAIFHSVSAFCNAGFGLDREGMMLHAGSPGILLTIALLCVLGGLGFPVLLDLIRLRAEALNPFRRWRWVLQFPEGKQPSRLTVHTKMVLLTTAVLVGVGTVVFYALERTHSLAAFSSVDALVNCLFHAVMPRTCGFNAVTVGDLQMPTLLFLMVLMAIGASPVSTGGGMKTTTVAILWQTVRAMMRNRDHVEAFRRTLPRRVVNASVAIVSLYLVAWTFVTGVLAATQEGVPFVGLLFEAASALSTVGLSMGATPLLDTTGRLLVCVAMLVGRVGPLAIVWAIVSRPVELRYEYPEEAVVVS